MILKQKTILIIGASQGIGRALSEELSAKDNDLILLSRNIENLLIFQNSLQNKYHKKVHAKFCDVTEGKSIKEGIDFALSKSEKIDLAIYNSGVGLPHQLINFSTDKIKSVIETNYIGLIYFLEYIIPVFLNQGYGTIAGVSSLADGRGYPGSASYCSSKAAASTFLESARVELKPHNIKVITIKPGFVKTAMTDKNDFKMPLLMTAEKAAKKIVKGLEKEKRIVQFPWITVFMTKIGNNVPDFIYDYFITRVKSKA